MTMFNMGMAPKGNLLGEDLFVGGIGVAATEKEYVWTKPAGASFVYMFIQNGGAGGGGGFTRASGVQGGGGGGGGGGGFGRFIMPALFMPNQIIIRPSNGGLGGAAGSPGVGPSVGAITFLSQPSSSRVTQALSTAATAPAAGTGAAGGTAGSANTIPTGFSASWITHLGQLTTSSGAAGGAGAASAAGTSGAVQVLPFACGAGGGAGVTTGDVVAVGGSGGSPSITGTTGFWIAPTQPAGAGLAGIHGRTFWGNTMFPSGSQAGAGGNSGGVVAGGRGGDGGRGCGGGGGGAGTTGGAGGNGGPGFVYIVAW